jgi:hypothetical protein
MLATDPARSQTLAELERELTAFCADVSARADAPVGPPEACARQQRLRSYQPNYAIVQKTEGDEDAIEARLSLRYMLTQPDCRTLPETRQAMQDSDADQLEATRWALGCVRSYASRREWFFAYTGEFDFYLNSRDSNPVIGRLHNPGFHVRQYIPERGDGGRARLAWVNFAVEHRSNGQALEIDTLAELDEAIQAYIDDDHVYFDQISQSSNYLSIEGRYELRLGDLTTRPACASSPRCLDFWVQLKAHYFSTGSEVRPVHSVFQSVDIADYDRVRLILSNTFGTRWSWLDSVELSGEWTIGDEAFDTDSLDVVATFNLDVASRFQVPLYIRGHIGPMGDLSTYTQREKSWGIGLTFR